MGSYRNIRYVPGAATSFRGDQAPYGNPFSVLSATLKGWWDADTPNVITSSSRLRVWTDKSGNGNDYVQDDGAKRPVYNTTNKQIVFTKAKSMQNTLTNTTGQGWSVFAVSGHNGPAKARFLTGTGNDALIGFGSDAQGVLFLNGRPGDLSVQVADTQMHIYSFVRKSDASGYLNFDALAQRNYTGLSNLAYNWNLNATTEPSNHKIKELLIYHGDPSTTDVWLIQGYLAHRHGLAGNLPDNHAYKNTAPA